MSKKNIVKSKKVIPANRDRDNVGPHASVRGKAKKVLDDFSSEDDDSTFEDYGFEKEIEEKNEIERNIKGEKERKDPEVNKEKIDKTVNKNINEKVKDEPKKAVSLVKKTRKDTIIDSITDAFKQLEVPEDEVMSHNQLKNTKINILEKKLAELTEKIVAKVAGGANTGEVPKPEEQKIAISNELATDALFNINIIITTFIENIAETGRKNEATKKYVPNVKGWTNRLLQPEKEKQLKECLKNIIALHGDKIKPFMSPISIWVMFMITSATEQVSENLSKNSEQPII